MKVCYESDIKINFPRLCQFRCKTSLPNFKAMSFGARVYFIENLYLKNKKINALLIDVAEIVLIADPCLKLTESVKLKYGVLINQRWRLCT